MPRIRAKSSAWFAAAFGWLVSWLLSLFVTTWILRSLLDYLSGQGWAWSLVWRSFPVIAVCLVLIGGHVLTCLWLWARNPGRAALGAAAAWLAALALFWLQGQVSLPGR